MNIAEAANLCRLFVCLSASIGNHAVYRVSCLMGSAADHTGGVMGGAGDRTTEIGSGKTIIDRHDSGSRSGKSGDNADGKHSRVHTMQPPFLAFCRKFARKCAKICGKSLEKLAFEQVLTHEQIFLEKKYHPVHSDGKFGEESGLQKFKEGI